MTDQSTQRPFATSPEAGNSTALLAILSALEQPDFPRAAISIATVLAHELVCLRVGLGMVEGQSTKLVALSGSADTRPELELPRKIAAAMDEAVDQHASLRYPVAATDPPRITLMHGELASAELGAAVLTIPMPWQQNVVGALTLIRRSENPWQDTEIAMVEQMAALIGPVLVLQQQAHEPLGRRIRNFPRRLWQSFHRPESAGVKIFVALLLVGVFALFFVPARDQVSAPARLEGVIQRSIAAPVDSFIQEVLVRPGAFVKQGQLLLTLADQDLRFEQSRLEAESARARSELAEAFARQDRARMVSAEARSQETEAQLALVREQIERARIMAPFEGVIIRGDPLQQAGAPVKRGEVLMVLAPASDFRLVLQVEDRSIHRLSPGQVGRVAFEASPDESFQFHISRITPVASVVDGKNCFEVEAALQGQLGTLRPGLEGVAHVGLGYQPLAKLWGKRLLDWLNFRAWVLFG